MNPLAVFLLQIVFSFVAFGLLAVWYIAPRLAVLSRRQALMVLLIPHLTRHIGMVFIVNSLVDTSRLPAEFAAQLAYGDLLTTVLALVGFVSLRWQRSWATAFVWIANIVGTLDLLNAYTQGLWLGTTTSPELVLGFGATWFIPTLLVPFLLVTHVMIFRLLMQRVHLDVALPNASKISPNL